MAGAIETAYSTLEWGSALVTKSEHPPASFLPLFKKYDCHHSQNHKISNMYGKWKHTQSGHPSKARISPGPVTLLKQHLILPEGKAHVIVPWSHCEDFAFWGNHQNPSGENHLKLRGPGWFTPYTSMCWMNCHLPPPWRWPSGHPQLMRQGHIQPSYPSSEIDRTNPGAKRVS